MKSLGFGEPVKERPPLPHLEEKGSPNNVDYDKKDGEQDRYLVGKDDCEYYLKERILVV